MSSAPQPTDANPDPAAPDAPWLGVHVLSEFIFCPRAGIIAFEEAREDSGQELDRAPRLDYLPDFEVALIEEGLQETWNRIGTLACWSIAGGSLIVGGTLFVWPWIALLLLPGGRHVLRSLVRDVRALAELHRRLAAAERAVAKEPDPASDQLQAVNWWGLLKAGFTPVEYEDPHTDACLRLAARPWRVLHKGAHRIPVFRKRWGKPELYPQHFVRMSAYCHVLTAAEGGESPYGVILFGDGYDGATVPNIDEHRQAFQNALKKARRLLEAMRVEGLIPEVPHESLCRGCPRGKPRVFQEGHSETVLNGSPVPAKLTRAANKKLYHSTCGDRFDWVPRHEGAAAKGIS